MNTALRISALLILVALSGCATVQYGDKNLEQELKKLSSAPGKVSLYVCRENAVFFGAGAVITAVVDKTPIGALKPNNFAHTTLTAGRHEIYLDRGPLNSNSGVLSIEAKEGDVVLVWAGMTGGGFGVLTVDMFASKTEGEQCVRGATYAIRSQ